MQKGLVSARTPFQDSSIGSAERTVSAMEATDAVEALAVPSQPPKTENLHCEVVYGALVL